MKNKCIALCLMAMILTGGILFAQTEKSLADKVSFSLEFGASLLSIDSEGVVDSLADTGFNEDGTKIGLAYEDELWGASAALKFGNENLRFLSGDMSGDFPLALGELYGWVQPFGGFVKFTGGIFENTDGVAGYTDDIDDYGMGVFLLEDEGAAEPDAELTGPALVNGFLTDLIFGPVTLQFLLAPNYSKERASELVSGVLSELGGQPVEVEVEADARFFRLGGRVIVDAGVGTFSALFKTFQYPMAAINRMRQIEASQTEASQTGETFTGYNGSKANFTTFGGYFDFTAVENLGVSLGYTGFLPASDGEEVDNVLYSGIDLRAAWTGIEGLSLSTHNHISFAKGAEKDWMGLGKDQSLFVLYNGIGATKELTGIFSVNATLSNTLAKIGDSDAKATDTLGLGAKFIVTVSENAEFNAGLGLEIANDGDNTLTTFSFPVGIVISF
jgi:hypothetical protein